MLSTVSVNAGNVHQTIQGLGGNYALGAITGQYTGMAQDSVGEYTLQYLNPKEARVGIPMSLWAPTNDNGQGSPTWSGYQDSGVVRNVFKLMQELQSKGITITLSTWTIPDWMCSNPSANQQRQLAPGMESAFSNAVASFAARAQNVYGVKTSYFSVNEADGGYNVLLSAPQEASLIKAVGAQFQSYGLPTKWLVGDAFCAADAVPYSKAILQDPGVLPYVAAISYHSWWSYQLPDSSFSDISALAKQYNLPVFVTELGWVPTNPSSWDNAAGLGAVYQKVLGPGQATVVMDWEYQNDFPVVSSDGTPYPVFYVIQQMSNTFTPGTQVVDSNSDDSALLPLAALDPTTGKLSVQVQNTGSTNKQVTINGLRNGQYSLIRTSATEQESADGTYTVNNGTLTVTLPANSFSTFAMTPASTPTQVAPPPPVVTPPVPAPVTTPTAPTVTVSGNSARLVKADTTTGGNWTGAYAPDGYNVIGGAASMPSYATLSPSDNSSYTWAASTSNAQALQKASNAAGRVAACWYAANSFSVNLQLTGGQSHQVALYLLDYDSQGRSERIDVIDPSTNAVLNSQTVSNFASGQYLVFNVTGNVVFRITKLQGPNAVLSGIFLGPA